VPLSIPLKLNGPRTARKNTHFVVTVTNGSDRSAVEHARVEAFDANGKVVKAAPTDKYGNAKLQLGTVAKYDIRARRACDITSNVLKLE
jgi:hypothetical protein